MTLDEAVRQYPNDDLYIGAVTAYFFIGTADEYFENIDNIEKDYKDRYKKSVKNKEDELNALLEAVVKNSGESIDDYIKRLGILTNAIREAEKKYNTAVLRLEKFRSFRDREVKEIYPKALGGYAIIIKGSGVGEYWMKEEFNRERKTR